MENVNREILLSFWKVHILHHAEKQAVYGQWMLEELRRHGYRLSPGTLYPMLERMEEYGWLKSRSDPRGGARARKDYRLTKDGKKVLNMIRGKVRELHGEVVEEDET
ncbi:MAG: PadR family transcriptional regulator [bacterium]